MEQSNNSAEEYNECPENAAGLLADIDIFRVLKLPNEAINRINLFVSAHTEPLQSRITELEAALLKVRDKHIKNPITYNIITKALNNEA